MNKNTMKILGIFMGAIITFSWMKETRLVYAQTVEWPDAPQTMAGSAILIDADTGAILYDKNSNEKAYPASMTKIMTGLLTIEKCKFNETVTISPAAAKSITVEDTNITAKAGEKFTVEQSLYALLLQSANEVAYALGEHVGGTLPKFVDMMNARAKELGANHTHFNNASGLYDPNHYTTAYDMAMIGRASFENETFLSIDSYTGSYVIGPTNLTNAPRTVAGTNLMFQGRKYYYEYCKGSKTGFTDQSGYTLISYAEKNGMRLICVVMKEKLIDDRYIDTKALFEYGFRNFKKVAVTENDVNSLFNNSSYYQSNKYSRNSLEFNLDSTFVDIPNDASLSDLKIKLSDTNKNSKNVGDNAIDTTNSSTANQTSSNQTASNNSLSNENASNTNSTDLKSNDTNNVPDDYFSSVNSNNVNNNMTVNLTYDGNTVGSSNLTITAKKNIDNSNLPYVKNNNISSKNSQKCLVLNVWYLLAGIIFLSIFVYVLKYFINKKMNK